MRLILLQQNTDVYGFIDIGKIEFIIENCLKILIEHLRSPVTNTGGQNEMITGGF